jgi:hypothetical protein
MSRMSKWHSPTQASISTPNAQSSPSWPHLQITTFRYIGVFQVRRTSEVVFEQTGYWTPIHSTLVAGLFARGKAYDHDALAETFV